MTETNAQPTPGGESDLGGPVRTVSGLTLASRVMGLARDLVTVRIFGDTAVGSAFAAALAIPNLFRRLFGEGALSAAFLPEYTRLIDSDAERAGQFASLTIGLVALITGAMMVVIEVGLLLVLMLTPANANRELSLTLIMVMLPFMPLVCTAAIMGGMLQSHGRFGPWASAPIVLNICMLAAAGPYFWLEGATAERWAFVIGVSVVIAGGLQVAWSVWALRGRVAWTRGVKAAATEGRAMLRRMIPVLIGLGTLQINSLLDSLIAMWPNWVGPTVAGREYPLDEASNAVLFYAQRLYQFPLGVFGLAVAAAVFPMLSRAAGDGDGFTATLRRGVRLSLFIALPATVGLVLVRRDLVTSVFSGGGGFSDAGLDRASAVLLGYAVAIWAYSLNHILTRAFYAKGDTMTPMRIAVAMVGLNIALNVALIWPLGEAGLAWSTAACAIIQCLWLTRKLRRTGIAGAVFDSGTRAAVGRIAAMTLAMGAAVVAIQLAWTPSGWGQTAGRLAVTAVVGGAVFGAAAAWSRSAELRELIGRRRG